MTRGAGPEKGLAEEESAPTLNERYYSAEPHEYFWWRFYMLLLAGDASKDLLQFAREGFDVADGGFVFKPGEIPDEESEVERRRRYSFTLTEATALHHHVAETLLRLYFAHRGFPPAPWLEIARERNYARFKERVKERFVDSTATPDDYDVIAELFVGTTDPSKLEDETDEASFHELLENIEAWLRSFAVTFLDDAPLHNSLKHGLAAGAGDASVMVGGGVLSASGPALAFLAERDAGERRVWSITTRWMNLGEVIASVFVGVMFIEALWKTARARYTGSSREEFLLFTGPTVDKFRKPGDGTGVVTSLSLDLRYFEDSDKSS